jgi:hypothetical protein
LAGLFLGALPAGAVADLVDLLPLSDVASQSWRTNNRDPKRWKRRAAPADDPPPAHGAEAEQERRAAFAALIVIVEQRAREGRPPVFARIAVKIEASPMKRAALYVRVLTGSQTTQNQERELRAVAAKAGWDIVQVYRDAGISGAKGRDERPEFDSLCKDAARRKFDMVAACPF